MMKTDGDIDYELNLNEFVCTSPYITRDYLDLGSVFLGSSSLGTVDSNTVQMSLTDKDGGGGIAPPEIDEKTPCEEAKEQLNSNPNYKAKQDELRKYLSSTSNKDEVEKGYSANKDGTFTQLKSSESGTSLEMPVNSNNTMGYIHNHTGSYTRDNGDIVSPYQIFSPKDVLKFLQIVHNTNYNGISTKDVYGTVVTSGGTAYQLRFNGDPKDPKIAECFNQDKEVINKEYKSLMNKSLLETGFLRFLQQYFPVNGLKLVKIKSDNTTQNVSLNEKNKAVKIDCQ